MGKKSKKLNVKKSMQLFSDALELMPGGASSNARLWSALFCPIYTPCTIFAKRAHGSHVWDVDGNRYIDYRLGFGPIILGHNYPKLTQAIDRTHVRGTVYALDTQAELEVSEMLIKAIPCAEMVRFSVTGTEATMHAIRLARAYTKKDIIVKFEGHFHGDHDYLLFSTDPPYESKRPYPMSLGIPEVISKLVIVETWNNFETIERTVKRYHDRIAAIICEPIMGNAAGIMPKPDYLKFLRELCDRYDILLIFDEVKTGFRVSYGGAQKLFNVKPDIATFAKSMSNGYPLSAIVGKAEMMRMFGPGKHHVIHGGTYASNPLSLTAAKETLKILKNDNVYAKINDYGIKMMNGIKKIFEDNDIETIMQGHPSMFQYVVTSRKTIHNYRELKSDYGSEFYAKMQYWLLTKGILVDEDNQECMYISFSHSKNDLDYTLNAFSFAVERTKNENFKIKKIRLPKPDEENEKLNLKGN
jgi:glutamate-1-semialdehyde 2,1-aminomutase